MPEEKDWNAWFAEQMAKRDRERAEKLNKAKADAAGTAKEPFNAAAVKALFIRLDTYGVDENTNWETLLQEAEYEYYVAHPEILSLEEYVEHSLWEDGFA
jgi:hypothetical protein